MTVTPLVHVEGLRLTSRDAGDLLAGVDLDIAPGERVALIGRSGSGKSLLTSVIAGTVSPALTMHGTVEVHGRSVRGCRPGTTGVALVQQDSADALNPLHRVGAQLQMPLRRTLTAERARTEAHRLLAEAGLEDPARILASFPAELSGGQRQRVCIALALACRSRLVIADEPTTALDVVSQAAVLRALRSPALREAAILFITHDLAVAAALRDRVVVIDRGRIVEDRPCADLLAAPHHAVTRALVVEAGARAEVLAG
ncbi:ATP-binding cassette domain-containing protein [Brachybacterium huguangmaarense]|uniref:ATP-binding cassette domain-containing protein n=1 Tax=Brachybacterium huguangmaarense TaxID=1652028 RepID=A0ABY6G1I0_9MICO|nr:ATP-binding cassette domain-containing protein [Brachybacterium huguangmaarense]UYG17061.1 ATP-binding cassette domain-containing protein [Brachybacterium huguangmaarense]